MSSLLITYLSSQMATPALSVPMQGSAVTVATPFSHLRSDNIAYSGRVVQAIVDVLGCVPTVLPHGSCLSWYSVGTRTYLCQQNSTTLSLRLQTVMNHPLIGDAQNGLFGVMSTTDRSLISDHRFDSLLSRVWFHLREGLSLQHPYHYEPGCTSGYPSKRVITDTLIFNIWIGLESIVVLHQFRSSDSSAAHSLSLLHRRLRWYFPNQTNQTWSVNVQQSVVFCCDAHARFVGGIFV